MKIKKVAQKRFKSFFIFTFCQNKTDVFDFIIKIDMSKRINYIISELKDQYLIEDNLRPWIIGFSGGKDSTALLQLVWLAISEVPLNERKREIHVVCNDTLVENPVIQSYVLEVLEKLKRLPLQ